MGELLKKLFAGVPGAKVTTARLTESAQSEVARDDAGLALVDTELDWDALLAEGLVSADEHSARRLRPLILGKPRRARLF